MQQKVVGLEGARVPVGVLWLGGQVPSVGVTERRRSVLPMDEHETGALVLDAVPEQDPSVDVYEVTVAAQPSPVGDPQVQEEQLRVSSHVP